MTRPGEEVRETVAPRDGRNIDPGVGELLGEGALQRVREVNAPPHGGHDWLDREPEHSGADYYGVPLLKEPVWKWFIPAYFYSGGLAGGCAVLGASAELLGGRSMAELSRRCRLISAGGAVASAGLLIADLGRPARFLHMLRVLRPSSPMNVGTWILSAFGACAGLAALPAIAKSPAALHRSGRLAFAGAGLSGLALTGYTGVLLAATAVPVWQGARRSLPILFSTSGAAAASSVLDLWPPGGRGTVAAHRFGVIAKACELGMTFALEREVAAVPRVARSLRTGLSGALWRSAQALTALSLAASLLAGRSRKRHFVAGVLGTAGALALRFGVVHAGRVSTRDPQASFQQQRAGKGAADVVHPPTMGPAAALDEAVAHGAT
jgi:formate-dependent nitrite reductase membrane component NrfD